MKARPQLSTSPKRLRARAERLLGTTGRDVAEMPVDDVQKLVHELQVHQIELEMQNDELRRTQLELVQARDRYADLYDFALPALLTLNAQGEILEANLNAGELLGLDRGKLLHQKFSRFVLKEAQDTFYLFCRQVFSSDARQSAELDLLNAQARRLVVHVEALRDPTSPRKQCRVSFTDITERKRAEAALRESEERLQTVSENLTEGLIISDLEGQLLHWNPASLKMHGFASIDECLLRMPEFTKILDLSTLDGSVLNLDQWPMSRAIRGELVRDCELRVRRLDTGVERILSYGGTNVRDSSGRQAAFLTVTDITERWQAEQAQRESEARLQAILDNSPAMIFLKDPQSRYLHFNRKLAEVIHLSLEESVGKTDAELFPPNHAAIFRANDRKILEAGVPMDFEEVTIQDDGPHTCMVTKFPLRDAQGKIYAIGGIATDITERKQAEEALQAREAQLHSFVQQAPAAIAMFDRNMNYLAASQRWTSDHGQGKRSLIGLNHYKVNPDLPDRWTEVHRKGLAGETQSCDEDLWLKADGARVWLRWSVSPWLDAHGNIGGIMILAENITARKEAEDALRNSEERLHSILDNSPAMIFLKDLKGRYLHFNRKLAEVFHLSLEKSVGKRDIEIYPPEQAAVCRANDRKMLKAGVPMDFEEVTIQDDGAHTGIVTKFPLRDASGKIHAIGGIVTDITERKRAEEQIARLNRVQAILAGIDHAIVHMPDRQKLLDEVCRVTVEMGGFKLAWVGLVSPDGSVQPVAQAGATGYLKGLRVTAHDVPTGRGPVGTALRENRPVVIKDIDQDARMAPWHDGARQFGLRYSAAFPIQIAGKVAGTFSVYASQTDLFTENELALLTQVSDDISYALTAMAGLAARKEAEAALRRSEHNLTIFFNQAPIGLLWLSASGTILRANQSQLEMLGYPAEEYVGQPFIKFCVAPSQGLELLKRLAAKETVRNFPMARRRKDGNLRHVLVDATPIWSGDELLYSSIFLRDVTDRIELEKEILQVSEREHRRMAQDLHDGLGQLLVGTAYLTSTLRQELAAKSLPEARQSARILEVINEAIAQTRSLARGLHPVEPEPNGLMVALQALADRTRKTFHVRCHFNSRQPVMIKDNIIATHLFRIAQEAITNAIKHGKSGRIGISLTGTADRINLAITDNGAGMPARPQKKSGSGLRIMHYRAGMIGGSVAIQQAAGGGTTIVCTVPLSGEGKTNLLLPPTRKKLKKD